MTVYADMRAAGVSGTVDLKLPTEQRKWRDGVASAGPSERWRR